MISGMFLPNFPENPYFRPMYIKSVHIQNIRSISELTLDFGDDEAKMAGWHVLIGENGSGKTTILRCMALAMIPSFALADNPRDWLRMEDEELIEGNAFLNVVRNKEFDLVTEEVGEKALWANINFMKVGDHNAVVRTKGGSHGNSSDYLNQVMDDESAWFSFGIGAMRRLTGGNPVWDQLNDSNPRAAAHISLFGEDVAITQIEPWLIKQEHKRLRGENGRGLALIKILLNDRELLPDGTKLIDISPEGLIFQDGNGANVPFDQLSNGYQSTLSLTIELLRQLIRVYGEEKTFENLEKQLKEGKNDDPAINYLPGVVLIDEIDAHLHPTWQTQIGQWFTKYFPKLQFIVTTHSPLICRACGDHGRIWHLRAPGSEEDAYEVTGQDRNRLVYGNILDAYGTQAFGSGVMRSEEGMKKFRRLGELNMKSIMGTLQPEERAEYEDLQSIFPSGK
jgi:predicted ATPase